MQTAQPRHAIELKISTIVAVSAILRESNPALLDAALKKMTGGAEDFFDDEFTVIDVAALDRVTHAIDWPVLISLLKSYRLNPVAVRNAPQEMNAAILAQGLSLDGATKADVKLSIPAMEEAFEPIVVEAISVEPIAHENVASASAKVAPFSVPTMIIDTPVRAGQRIYARGSDLIITAPVSNGAEVIADGSIHIYAPLRGRALAGASGNTSARIYTMSMEAELVSIAGMYRTFENDLAPELMRHAAQVRLIDERIDIQAIR